MTLWTVLVIVSHIVSTLLHYIKGSFVSKWKSILFIWGLRIHSASFSSSLLSPHWSRVGPRVYSALMSAMREAMEWTYKDLKQKWSSQDFKMQLKIRKCSISLLYKSVGPLWNFKTCLHHGGQMSSCFDLCISFAGTLHGYMLLKYASRVKYQILELGKVGQPARVVATSSTEHCEP